MQRTLTHCCVITPNYPDRWFIERGSFVDRLVGEWQRMGVSVDVIAPRKISNLLRTYVRKKYPLSGISGDRIIYPTYLSVSNKKILNLNLQEISLNNFTKAALRGVRKADIPEFFYGQFLMNGGRAALTAGKVYSRPAFADVGESILTNNLSVEEYKQLNLLVKSLDGFACVSEDLANEIISLGAKPENVMHYPNTVDMNRFKLLDKVECRKRLQLPPNDSIAIFTGHFIERKGPLRVLEALRKQNGRKVKAIFIGRGEQEPSGECVLHKGSVPNSHLATWLGAADIFVLPTLHEGHCNAINEAMACGLPIISSDIPEVRNQVPKGSGLLVDPTDTGAIAAAIEHLISDDELREKMGRKAYDVQRKRSKKSRASVILKWIASRIENSHL